MGQVIGSRRMTTPDPGAEVDTDPTTLAACENCGAPANYHPDLILCPSCGKHTGESP